MTRGLTVALSAPGGSQLCLPVAKAKRAKDGALILRSSTRPRATLRLKQRKDGRLKYRLGYTGQLQLPSTSPLTLGVGLYSNPVPFRATISLRTRGKTSLALAKPAP